MITSHGLSVVAVIPAHLASVRFPRKILFEIHGLPMIEHVRRRALMCSHLDRVIVATCDEEIASVIRSHGGEVVMTSNLHSNGTSRVAEAIRSIDCTHVLLLQGDEPLLLPRHIELLCAAIHSQPQTVAWNATGSLQSQDELDRHSFVKAAVSPFGRILFCFRRSPFYADSSLQHNFVRKILGILAFRKDFLIKIAGLEPSPAEQAESIEQLRVIENGYSLMSVPVDPSIPSINEPHEVSSVYQSLLADSEQQLILSNVLDLARDAY